jgi:flagellar hook-associated protein 3 FlgL
MSSISSTFNRAPNLLMSQSAVSTLGRTNLALHRVHMQLATGVAIHRFSDDAVKAAAISVLDDRIERAFQRQRNLSHADTSLNMLDQALGDAGELINEARSIASAQVGSISSAAEREAQAHIVDSLIQSLYTLANRQSVVGHMFAGSTPGSPAVLAVRGGYRYAGSGPGLLTDIGLGSTVPVTLGAGNIVGSTSARIEGSVDLRPGLTSDTRLAEALGARGMGIVANHLEFAFAGGPRAQVDLSSADTIQDVVNTLTAALRDYESAHGLAILGPGGVSISGGALSIDVLPGPSELTFYDVGGGTSAADLGLGTFTSSAGLGEDLQPRLTWRTPISALRGITGVLGAISISNLGQTRTIDLSAAETVEDIRNLIQSTGLGIRVDLNQAGTSINIINEVAGGRGQAMTISEVSGNDLTATRLGIRSLTGATRLADFNDGRGIQIVTASTDPVSGDPNAAGDVDFTIRLGDTGQTTFSVNLRPQDIATVDTLLARINEEAAAANINVPADFEAMLSDGPNGIVLRQNPAFATPIEVAQANNSPAAQQLGLLNGTWDSTTGRLRGADHAHVRVENLFTHLIDLRDSLRTNDTFGITLAGERLEQAVERLSEARALVGGYGRRVQDAIRQQEDQTLLDETTRSQMRDTDFTEAAVRLNMLQTQLQGAMIATTQSLSRSLLDFLR